MCRKNVVLGLIFYITIIALGHLKAGSNDSYQRIAMTKSMVFDHSFVTKEYGLVKYAPLQPMLMIPPYVLGYTTGKLLGKSEKQRHRVGYRFCAFLFIPVIVSITCVLYFNFILQMNFNAMITMLSTFALLFGTLMLPYSRIMFSEPLNGLLLLISAYYIFRFTKDNHNGYIIAALFSVGILCLNNFVFVLHYAIVATYICAYVFIFKSNREFVKVWACSTLILLCVLSLWALYNDARYHDYFVFGYGTEGFKTPFLVGFYGLMFSIGRGAFIYMTLTIICVIYFMIHYQRMHEKFQHVGLFFLSLFSVHLFLYSIWDAFEGGWCWGPRFLLPFIPILHLSFPYVLESFSKWNYLTKGAFICVCFCALLVNGFQYIGYWEKHERAMFNNTGLSYMAGVFDPEYASLLNSWEFSMGIQRLPQFIVVGILTFSVLVYLHRIRFLDRV